MNDQPEHAREVGALLAGRPVMLNLIPWNPVAAGADAPETFTAPAREDIDAFYAITTAAGVVTSVRRTMGADVDGACGQLVISEMARAAKQPAAQKDVEDLGLPGRAGGCS